MKSGKKKPIRTANNKLEEIALWRIKRGSEKDKGYFQTTIQRWFADPILSNDGEKGIADRTLRTVFTHDHFGPSNIQQHGFYNALLVEPGQHKVLPDACAASKGGGDQERGLPRRYLTK